MQRRDVLDDVHPHPPGRSVSRELARRFDLSLARRSLAIEKQDALVPFFHFTPLRRTIQDTRRIAPRDTCEARRIDFTGPRAQHVEEEGLSSGQEEAAAQDEE